MNRILDFIEEHKYGIIIALIVHVAIFIYFQIQTYQEVVVYEPWSFRGKNIESPDDISLTPDQIQTPEEADLFKQMDDEEISSFVKDEQDKRETSFDKDVNYTSYEGDAYSNVKDFESEVIQKLQEGREKDDNEKTTELDDGESTDKQNNNPKESQEASEKAVAGKTMVSYSLSNRHPHNKNDWYVRNPGYTCGNVNGTVVVQIRVDQAGNVVNARYLESESNNADHCMIRQAEKYALMSRFNYDSSAEKSQEGKITYLFVYRK